MIDAPDKEYFYHCTNNERYNEMRREAMQGTTTYLSLKPVLTLPRMLSSRG